MHRGERPSDRWCSEHVLEVAGERLKSLPVCLLVHGRVDNPDDVYIEFAQFGPLRVRPAGELQADPDQRVAFERRQQRHGLTLHRFGVSGWRPLKSVEFDSETPPDSGFQCDQGFAHSR